MFVCLYVCMYACMKLYLHKVCANWGGGLQLLPAMKI